MAFLPPLVAGNWKMNGLRSELALVAAVRDGMASWRGGRAHVAICPPFTLLAPACELAARSPLLIGGQDCAPLASGPHTGDVSAEMLKDAGASLVIVGHSERRAAHGETDAIVRTKAEAALRAGLLTVVCVGESRAERDGGATLRVIGRQIDESLSPRSESRTTVIAYEPVWAIGTGLTPSPTDIEEVHSFIRRRLSGMLPGEGERIRLLYGGSVNPSNARELSSLAGVDGFLVGGASLKGQDFLDVIGAYG